MNAHDDWKDLGSNIIKLEGYGVYVTYIDDEYYQCDILPSSGHPPLDPDGCINWDKMEEPPNQRFLNLLNSRFDTAVTMNDFGSTMSIREVKEFVAKQREQKQKKEQSEAELRWLVKNIKERDK